MKTKTIAKAKKELFSLLMENAPISGNNEIMIWVGEEYEHVVKHVKLTYNGRRVTFKIMKITPINYNL